MNVTSVSSMVGAASADDAASVLVAKKALDATRLQGQMALELITKSVAPTDGRGQLVSKYI